VLIDLTYDAIVELQILLTGRYPTSLMDVIATDKLKIYRSLGPDLARQGILSGSCDYEVEGRKFTALFASDTWKNDPANDIRPLRVLHIDEHS
jgi:hypothetical protein